MADYDASNPIGKGSKERITTRESEVSGTTSGSHTTRRHWAADDAVLAGLGYKSEFRREFTLIETIAFSFSVMGIVSAIASTLSFPLVSGGHFGMIWGWVIPSLFVMTMACSIAELASSMPTSAGLYYFSAKMAPAKYAPLASWITGWANITGQISLVCSIDFTCAEMITTAIVIGTDGKTVPSAGATFGVLVAILLMHGFICSSATHVLARLNLFYVIMNVGTSVAAIVALLVGAGDQRVSTHDAFLMFENHTGWANNGWAFLLAFTAPMWILTGYDSAAHISEETTNAAFAAPIAIIVGVAGASILGWLLLIAASFATRSVPDLLASTLPLPMGQLFLDVLGKRGMLAIWSFIIVVQLVTGAAQGVDASRVVYAFARDRALPGSTLWRKINPRTQTPVNAVWFVMFWSAVAGLLGFSEAALSSLAGASVIGLYFSYAVPVSLRITSGRNKFKPGPFNLGRWSTLVGSVACSWVVFISVVLIFPPTSTPSEQTMNYSVIIIAGVILLSGGWWLVSAHRWFKGPVRTVEDDDNMQSEASNEKVVGS